MQKNLVTQFLAPVCLSVACFAFTPKSLSDVKDGQYNAPGYMAAEVQFTCPVDDHIFASPVAHTTTDEGVKRDLMRINGQGKYYEHLVHQCPKCHYSGLKGDFELELTHDQKQILKTYLAKNARRKLDQVQENLVAAKMYELMGAEQHTQAEFYLYAAYLLSDKPNRTAERVAYQKKTVELLLSKDFGPDAASQIAKAEALYLVGELHRRFGRFDLSTEYFAQADAVAHKPEWLATLIDEQAQLALERNNDDKL